MKSTIWSIYLTIKGGKTFRSTLRQKALAEVSKSCLAGNLSGLKEAVKHRLQQAVVRAVWDHWRQSKPCSPQTETPQRCLAATGSARGQAGCAPWPRSKPSTPKHLLQPKQTYCYQRPGPAGNARDLNREGEACAHQTWLRPWRRQRCSEQGGGISAAPARLFWEVSGGWWEFCVILRYYDPPLWIWQI